MRGMTNKKRKKLLSQFLAEIEYKNLSISAIAEKTGLNRATVKKYMTEMSTDSCEPTKTIPLKYKVVLLRRFLIYLKSISKPNARNKEELFHLWLKNNYLNVKAPDLTESIHVYGNKLRSIRLLSHTVLINTHLIVFKKEITPLQRSVIYNFCRMIKAKTYSIMGHYDFIYKVKPLRQYAYPIKGGIRLKLNHRTTVGLRPPRNKV